MPGSRADVPQDPGRATATCRTCRGAVPLNERGEVKVHQDPAGARCPGSSVPPIEDLSAQHLHGPPSDAVLGVGLGAYLMSWFLLVLTVLGSDTGGVAFVGFVVLQLLGIGSLAVGVTRLARRADRALDQQRGASAG